MPLSKADLINEIRIAKTDNPNADVKKLLADHNHYAVDVKCANCKHGQVGSYVVVKGETVASATMSLECPYCGCKGRFEVSYAESSTTAGDGFASGQVRERGPGKRVAGKKPVGESDRDRILSALRKML